MKLTESEKAWRRGVRLGRRETKIDEKRNIRQSNAQARRAERRADRRTIAAEDRQKAWSLEAEKRSNRRVVQAENRAEDRQIAAEERAKEDRDQQDKTQFTRLRKSAERAGLNPLTVLGLSSGSAGLGGATFGATPGVGVDSFLPGAASPVVGYVPPLTSSDALNGMVSEYGQVSVGSGGGGWSSFSRDLARIEADRVGSQIEGPYVPSDKTSLKLAALAASPVAGVQGFSPGLVSPQMANQAPGRDWAWGEWPNGQPLNADWGGSQKFEGYAPVMHSYSGAFGRPIEERPMTNMVPWAQYEILPGFAVWWPADSDGEPWTPMEAAGPLASAGVALGYKAGEAIVDAASSIPAPGPYGDESNPWKPWQASPGPKPGLPVGTYSPNSSGLPAQPGSAVKLSFGAGFDARPDDPFNPASYN